MAWTLLALGVATTSVAWWAVSMRHVSVWRVMPPLYVALGALSLLVAAAPAERARAWHGWRDASIATEVAWGLGSGLALYVATRLAVPILGRSATFAHQTEAQYAPSREVGRGAALVLSLLVVTGEELLWRRGVQQGLAVDAAVAAVITWAASVAASVASLSLPIIAGAVVGGAVWTAGGWLSGGVLVPLCSHAIWTTLMLVMPPGLARERMSG